MSTFVKSLKRLYTAGKVTMTKISYYLEDEKITREEYEYIIGD